MPTVKVKDYDGSNKFQLNGLRQKIAVANAGDTIVFDQSDSSNVGHPLVIALYYDGHHNAGGNEYTVGVTKTGTPGSSGAKTTFVLNDQNLNGTYYYYCQNHTGMGGMIHFGGDTDINGNIVGYPIIDEGATAYDAQDNDENLTSNINKTVEKWDNVGTDGWQNQGAYYGDHTNPWKIQGTDTRESAAYRVSYNITDSGGLSAPTRTKIFNIGDTPPTLAELLIGSTFWLVNGLDENGVGYTDAGTDASFWGNHWGNFCIVNPAGGVTVPGARSTLFNARWTEPNHGRYPPVAGGYPRSAQHWRGQVTFLDESNYVGWTIDTEEKASGGGMSNGNYALDDTGVSFQLYTINGQQTFKIKLISVDQLQPGTITRCDNFKRIVYNSTMTMVSAIKCAEGDVPNTANFMATPTWTGSGDLKWVQAYY